MVWPSTSFQNPTMSRAQKVYIVLAISFVVLAGFGYFGMAKFREFLYPPAPPMPAVVSATMPDILAQLETTLKAKAPHILETLQPGLSTDEVAKLETKFNIKLPDDIKQLYQWRNGARPNTNTLEEFFPLYQFVPLQEMLEEREIIDKQQPTSFVQRAATKALIGHRDSWLCLFADGAGNGYFYDPKRTVEQGSYFYHYMEDADFLFFPSMKNVMAGVARCYEKEAFKVKPGTNSVELDENYEAAEKIWTEFGARRQ